MAVQATLDFGGTLTKLLALSNLPGTTAIDRSMKARIDLHAGTNPAIDDAWARRMTLTGGALTLSLLALPETGLITPVSFTGKVVYAVVIHVLDESAAMTFSGAAAAVATPYELFGGATSQITMDPGGWFDHYSPSGFGTIGAGAFNVGVVGTGTDQFDIAILVGT